MPLSVVSRLNEKLRQEAQIVMKFFITEFDVDPEVQAAVDRVLQRARDPDCMRHAAERMDRMREEMRKRVGDVDIAVPLIGETRDEP